MTCPTCPGSDPCDHCPTCDSCVCRCEPPVVTAPHDDWRCEACGRGILDGERVRLYLDDEDGTMVTHLECPTPRAQA